MRALRNVQALPLPQLAVLSKVVALGATGDSTLNKVVVAAIIMMLVMMTMKISTIITLITAMTDE